MYNIMYSIIILVLFVIGVMISSRFQATGGDSGTCSSWYFTHGMYCNGDEAHPWVRWSPGQLRLPRYAYISSFTTSVYKSRVYYFDNSLWFAGLKRNFPDLLNFMEWTWMTIQQMIWPPSWVKLRQLWRKHTLRGHSSKSFGINKRKHRVDQAKEEDGIP